MLAVALPGCNGNGEKKDQELAPDKPAGKSAIFVLSDDELYAGIPDDMLLSDLRDDKVVFPPDKGSDAELVARWVTERRNLISWCLDPKQTVTALGEGGEERYYKKIFANRSESRLDQAISIGLKVVDRVPEASQVRYRLAQCLFNRGSYEFWLTDGWLNAMRTAREKRDEAEATRCEKNAKEHGPRAVAYQTLALQHLFHYANAYPMDKTPLDWIWKAQFQLGQFREAVRTINALLDAELVKDDVRTRYEQIRADIQDYLSEVQINAAAPKPASVERMLRAQKDK